MKQTIFQRIRLIIKSIICSKRVIRNVCEKYNIDFRYDFIVFYPSDGGVEKDILFECLDKLIIQFEKQKNKLIKKGVTVKRNNEKFVIISDLIISLQTDNVQIVGAEYIDYFMMCLFRLRYCLIPMHNHIIMADIVNIEGRNCDGLINNNIIMKNKLIEKMIFGIENRI